MSTPEQRRRLKAYCVEWDRVAELRRLLSATQQPPPWPELPAECVGMVCGGKGRRSGKPCQSTDLYPNGRCKWHGGASTGPKTAEGKERSQANLLRGPKR